jgi:hypothetical protein
MPSSPVVPMSQRELVLASLLVCPPVAGFRFPTSTGKQR